MSERNLAKRGELVEKWGSNYFRDFVNIRKYRSGKTFLANARIFKRDAAMYFPNFHGKSLEKGKEGNRDTTNVLKGRVSVVNVYSSEWGHTQVRSFTSPKVNPGLHDVLRKHKDVAQMVDINIEENILKAWIISFFSFNLRNNMKKEDWGRYFVVRRGVSQKVRETIGLLNKRVGYVYLVDEECRIRWAGSADAEGTEKEDLTKGFARLIEEAGTGGSKIVPPVRIKGEGKGEKPLPVPLPIAFK
jgi:ATPase complex subunit ATP10